MEIIPAIDILDGKVVRLFKGKYDQVKEYDLDPVEQIKIFADAGVSLVHIVDLDGAKYGKLSNLKTINNIVKNSSVAVEVGGGIRDEEKAGAYLDAGVSRVIIGTLAVKDVDKTKKILSLFPNKVVLGLDTINGMVAVEGWEESSKISMADFVNIYKNNGVRALIFTDISKDGTLQGVSFEELRKLLDFSPFPVIASGGVASIDDIMKLKEIGKLYDKLEGVISGKAIYEGKLDLNMAIRALRN